MKTRTITGIAAAGLVLLILFSGNYYLTLAAVILVAFVGAQEFEHLFFKKYSLVRQVLLFIPLALTIYLMSERILFGMAAFATAFVFICVYYVIKAHKHALFQNMVVGLSLSAFGLIYLVCALGFILPILKMGEHGKAYLLWLFAVVFLGDTIAYFVGSMVGSRPLTPNLSPKKTKEGALAALIGSFVVTWVWSRYIMQEPVLSEFSWKLMYFTPAASFLAQIGDLLESLLKRSRQKKDTGQLLPGHGGILDRIDGLVLVSPVYFIFLSLVLSYES